LSKDEEISRFINHNKNQLVDMKKSKNKRKAQQETQTMDKGTSIDLIDMENPNVLKNEVVSVEVFSKVDFNKQLYGKATSTDLVEVDIPLIPTNKFIRQSKDVVTPINTKNSDTIMMTQVNHDETKTNIKKDKIPMHPKIYVP
jgi:hypothetical protein